MDIGGDPKGRNDSISKVCSGRKVNVSRSLSSMCSQTK